MFSMELRKTFERYVEVITSLPTGIEQQEWMPFDILAQHKVTRRTRHAASFDMGTASDWLKLILTHFKVGKKNNCLYRE